jgi:hypothetical protein
MLPFDPAAVRGSGICSAVAVTCTATAAAGRVHAVQEGAKWQQDFITNREMCLPSLPTLPDNADGSNHERMENTFRLYVKGAAEYVLRLCNWQVSHGDSSADVHVKFITCRYDLLSWLCIP